MENWKKDVLVVINSDPFFGSIGLLSNCIIYWQCVDNPYKYCKFYLPGSPKSFYSLLARMVSSFRGPELLVRSIIVLTVGLSINYVLAFGEELGWRGHLQQRIIDTGFKFPYALCGLIWAGWHFPFLWYLYNPTSTEIYQSIFFTINVIFLGIIVGRLRIESGSIWIPTMVHAAHNTINFELFAPVFFCSQCELYVGENGIIMGIIYGLIVIWMLIRSKKSANSLK